MKKGQKTRKYKKKCKAPEFQTKQLPTEELKVAVFRWMSVCEPKEDEEND